MTIYVPLGEHRRVTVTASGGHLFIWTERRDDAGSDWYRLADVLLPVSLAGELSEALAQLPDAGREGS